MSAFCVFGVSRIDCRRKAERKVSRWIENEKRLLTPAEYSREVDKVADEIFIASTRAIQISPTFDAPQFCLDWQAIAESGGHIKAASLHVRDVKRDDEGKPLLRNGNTIATWRPYTEQ